MILGFYGRKVLLNTMAVVFISLTILTYGPWYYFDLFAIAVFIIALILTNFQINIAATIIVLTIGRLIEFITFSYVIDNLATQAIIYSLSVITIYHCKTDKLIVLITSILTACLVSQIYWQTSHYQAPQLFFSWLVISIALLTRKFLLLRPFIIYQLIGRTGDYSRLDWHLRKIYGLAIIIELSKLIEYLARHLTTIKPLIIYTSYPIIMHALSCLCLWLVYKYALELTSPSKMIA